MGFNDRILIIDDDPAILEAFQTILAGAGTTAGQRGSEIEGLFADMVGRKAKVPEKRVFVVDTALQGEIGFEKIRKAAESGVPFAVAFIDMRMPPGWDGIRTAREIRLFDPNIQLVVVTAYSDASISEIVSQVGFTNRLLYLKKPFDDEEILQLADSLSMRWNLEKKVRNFMAILEGIIGNLAQLKITQDAEELRSSLTGILSLVGEFLDTRDLFLATIEEGRIEFRIGLGKFADGITEEPAFQEIVRRVLSEGHLRDVFRMEGYVVMPLILRSCKNVVIGVRPEREIEGTDNLLKVLATSAAKIFDMNSMMTELRQEVDDIRQREKELRIRLVLLEKTVLSKMPERES